jgi:NitT/TauT family transport system substrate-binding protein
MVVFPAAATYSRAAMTVQRVFLVVTAAILLVVPTARPAGQTQTATAQTQTPAPPAPLGPDAPFTIACATATLEATPIFVAAQGPFGPRMQFINGGVRTLANTGAHAATNATTQMLVVLRDNPKVRLLFTLVEGNYRIVAKRSAGIAKLADLKGKRVVVPRTTSAHYYLVAMLRSVGLAESDVTLVTAPATAMAAALVKGDADAISMWEPESENAVRALGRDATIFQNNKIYREFFSVYSTTDVLADPRRRAELVDFVRALRDATSQVRRDPGPYLPLISKVTGHPQDQIARSWKHHDFSFSLPADLVDVITEEEKWVAVGQQRAPRSRQELAGLIDPSVLSEDRGTAR